MPNPISAGKRSSTARAARLFTESPNRSLSLSWRNVGRKTAAHLSRNCSGLHELFGLPAITGGFDAASTAGWVALTCCGSTAETIGLPFPSSL